MSRMLPNLHTNAVAGVPAPDGLGVPEVRSGDGAEQPGVLALPAEDGGRVSAIKARCPMGVERSSYGYPRRCYLDRGLEPVKYAGRVRKMCRRHRAMVENGGRPEVFEEPIR